LIADKELLLLLKTDPENGLEALMDSYIGLVYTIVSRKLVSISSKEDIEECVSDIFYVFYTQRDAIDLEKGSVKAYLSTMAKRRAIDRFRQMKHSANKSCPLDALEYELEAEKENVECNVFASETKEMLRCGIIALGEPDSEIFIRKYYFGQSTKEIAKAVKVKENTIDKKVSRGLGKLRQALGGVL